MKTKKKFIFLCASLSYILIILFWGLRPFNFRAANGVEWSQDESGISFTSRGYVYHPINSADSDQPPILAKNESFSIELWLRPGSDDNHRFSYIFGLYDGHYQEIFSFSQVKSLLNISKNKNPSKKESSPNWRWMNHVFSKGKMRYIAITSDKTVTTVYLDGKRTRRCLNFSLALSKELTPTWSMVVGNDPTGKKPWVGKIYGLAIYNHLLSPKQVSRHFEKWRYQSALSLPKEKRVLAIYPMNEHNGKLIHNVVNNRYNLSIPDRFKILKKTFLQLSGAAFKLNGSSLRDMLINISGFIPLGYLILITIYSTKPSWRDILLAVLGGTVVSLIIEILQAYLPTRNSSLTDLIFNSFGTGLGVILAIMFLKIINPDHKTLKSIS